MLMNLSGREKLGLLGRLNEKICVVPVPSYIFGTESLDIAAGEKATKWNKTFFP